MAAPKPATIFVTDLSGEKINALDTATNRAIVFLFLSTECPISNKYAPEIRRLASEFEPRGIAFRLIYPNRDETARAVRWHTKEYNLPLPAFRDPAHELVRASQVRVTPEAALYRAGAGWVYRGRIDDRFVDLGKDRPAAAVHDLRDVLAKIAAGETVRPIVTHAVGCSIAP